MYLLSSNNPVLITDYFGLVDTSINASIRACLLLTTARQRLACLEDLLELCGQNNALQDAINKQRQSLKTAQEALNSCLGKVKREFPSQFLNNTIEEIEKMAKNVNKMAKKAYKLLNDCRSKK
jgi:HAMP domain-containing protein